jgi:uncharacterized protein
MTGRWLAALAAVLVSASLGFLPQAWADVAIPTLKARVTDLTGTLTPEQVGTLEQRLAAFEAKKGSQIVVLMLPSTKPEAIEQFSIRLAEAWKIGRKGTDDGLILVIAKEDRRLRIEVGYGLEGAIPDAVANRVISETITPRFKAGDYYGGISAGVDQLIKLVEGEKLPAPAASGSGSTQSAGSRDPFEYMVPAFFIIFIVGAMFRTVLGRFPGALATGAAAGVLGWIFFSLGWALIAALVGFLFTLINAGGRGLGSYTSGSGSSWGGSSGGGGFSGGGGSFGGGGSSGSW